MFPYYYFKDFFEAIVAQGHKRVCIKRRLWVRFPLRVMNYLMFSFSCSDDEAKSSVDLRHSTYNA